MKRLFIGECQEDNIFELVDPTSFLEIDFEAQVIKALTCLLPGYMCGVFAGTFILEGTRRSADLALIHKSFSHWFVIEVELAGHSFEGHVLPQVRCFRYGAPEDSCITSLMRGFEGVDAKRAESILRHIPRYVAVVANLPNLEWAKLLNTLDVQLLTVSIYRDHKGRSAHEVEGRLNVPKVSLGFARFSAIENCLRIPRNCGLPVGNIQIIDQFDVAGSWTVHEASGVLWVSKDRGPTLLVHESYVQILRASDGRIWISP
ncbi:MULTISPECIES: hypothetical protein [unclassified Variovorax]|uniref:hypothetical protein n=1 Tax=unclassified Variovorax TaxID=663243 RepID=UPI001BD21EA8|nr:MULTISPECIES: hypothetical protein [unclassified Variovorax]